MISSIASLDWMEEDLASEEPSEDAPATEPAVMKALSGDELEDVRPVLLTL